jgi:SAM-dependent methyltransferase
MSWDYGTLATEIYDLDKPIGHSFGDVGYYRRVLAGTGGPVLEPATGNGRMLIPLLEAGLLVEGLDTSPEMLAVCRQNCRDRGHNPVLREADMTSFVQPGRYAAVILPTGSVCLLDGRGALRQALACFAESLMPSGRLIVDVVPPHLEAGTSPMRHWRRDAFRWTMQTMHVEYDSAANQVTSFLRYEKWQDGALIATELQPFRLQYWSLSEFGQLLTEAGFTGISVTADYRDDRSPGPGSDIWTFQATLA